ncbi:thiosulfate transporter subunit [Xaviernesmea oryzae]|uniref:Thiosulfate transporter subunit n=1 Tax=Xaviernesmea oryzae TaxID=464029 RepID=A0A1Q9B1V9_9HYPH|nr:sulfate ABC transporter substrate-binding protein [Xaviernesmea oryzae]OLP61991.1 thiosulfate transporter subunit [Xaviernesmea oryzae]SEK98125.1 sulfate transport system substrate-binding protein [Xaviernesmea oryzae]
MKRLLLVGTVLAALVSGPALAETPGKILNASYDISRELFVAVNKAFIAKYKADTGKDLQIDQSHAGSSKQARSILEGLEADVVTFNQSTDIDQLVKGGFVSADWRKSFANDASPYYSFPAFLVRAGNPKQIKNWDDLVRDDVKVIFPNPKTSGNARYTYLAAYAFAKQAYGNDEAKATAFVKKLFDNVPVFDTGGRAATTTFAERNIGDVLITFEAETRGIAKELGSDKFQVIVPPVSLKADFPVAVVDKVVDQRGSREIAKAYLSFLYTADGQKILAENGNRVNEPSVVDAFKDQFPTTQLLTVNDVFGGWDKVQKEHFASGGLLDQIYGQR